MAELQKELDEAGTQSAAIFSAQDGVAVAAERLFSMTIDRQSRS
jgi:hypothetical protein